MQEPLAAMQNQPFPEWKGALEIKALPGITGGCGVIGNGMLNLEP